MSSTQMPENTEKNKSSVEGAESYRGHQGVVARALRMAFGTFGSRITGFIRDQLILATFNRFFTDAFVVAFRLPNLFRRLLGEGSLAVSFIPVFVDQLATGKVDAKTGESEAYRLACAMFSLLLSVLLVLTTLGVVFMEPILELLIDGDGFRSVAGKFELTLKMARIMFAFIFLVSLYAYFTALLQSLKVFGLPAFAPALFNLVLIVVCLLPAEVLPLSGEVLAWAVLVGGFSQMAVLLPRLYRLGYLPKWSWRWRSSSLQQVFRAMGPSLIGMGLLQLMGLVNVKFASRFAEGTHSYIYAADRILELPLSLFAVSLGSALLPTLADHWARGEREQMGEVANSAMRMILFIAIPSACGLWFLGQPIAEVLFMRNQFTSADAVVTGQIVQIYAFTLLAASGVRVLAPTFYSIKNTWLPALSSLCALLFHVGLALFLMPRMGLEGLIWSTVLSSFLNLLILALAYRHFIGPLYLHRLIKGVAQFLICALAMTLVIRWYDRFFELATLLRYGRAASFFVVQNEWSVQLLRAAVLFLVIGLAALTYFLTARALRVPELEDFLHLLRRKTAKKKATEDRPPS